LSHCLPISIFFNYFDEISQHIRLWTLCFIIV
jgi:hypothetical protein